MRNIDFKIIRDRSYAEEINEILAEEEMEAPLSISYVKYPDLFTSLERDGVRPPLIVVGMDREKAGRIVGVGACAFLGEKLGYLNSFRIRKEYRNKVRFSEAYRLLITESRKLGAEDIITTILSDNEPVERMLTRKRKGMPIYEFCRNINFYSIKNRNRGNIPVEDSYVEEYGEEEGYKKVLIKVKKKGNKLYIAKDYKKIYELLYKYRKIISLMGYPEFPEKGKKLDFFYADISIKDKISGKYIDETVLYKEMDQSYRTGREKYGVGSEEDKEGIRIYEKALKYLAGIGLNCNFFMIGAYEGSLEDKILKKQKAFKYRSKLYRVYYEEDEEKMGNIGNREIRFNFWDL